MVHMCGHCGFTGSERDFTEETDLSPLVKEQVWTELAPIVNARGVVRTVLQVTGVLDLFGATAESSAELGGAAVLPLPSAGERLPMQHRRAI